MNGLGLSKRTSISRRLAGFAFVFVTTTLVAASVILYLIVAGVVREQIDQRLDTQIDGLRGGLSVNAEGRIVLATSLDGPPFDRQGLGWYWQVSGDQVHLTSRSLAGKSIASPPRPFDWRHVLSGQPQPADHVQFRGEDLYVRVEKATIGDRAIEISVTAPQSALAAPARRALLWLVAAMALLGAVLVAGIFLQVHYGLRPLRQLTSNVSAITAGILPRLPDVDVDELRPVSQEINRLVDQNLQRLADTRLHFANLAHGLKTPVASLSLAFNSTNDPEGEMRSLVDIIDRRIRHHLARARKTTSGTAAATIIKPRIDDLILVMSRIHTGRAVITHCEINRDLAVACDAEDIDEIFGNLLDNAFKWASRLVTVSAATEGNAIVITIEDDGPGMDEAKIAEAFLAGVRMDETVPGHGFGLTIASELVKLYGGSTVLQNASGAGFRQVVTLPRAVTGHDIQPQPNVGK
jgi:signal transduction histidine kinase